MRLYSVLVRTAQPLFILATAPSNVKIPQIVKIDYHPYQLAFSSKHLGSVAKTQVREGLLLRIEFADMKSCGYAGLHPWPELGDADVTEQLQYLSCDALFSNVNSPLISQPTSQENPLLQQSLSCAYADALARSRELSLYTLEQLKNHALCELTHPDIVTILEQKQQLGFTIIKLKVGNNWTDEREVWRQLAQQFPQLKWRLDFNERLNWEQLNETINWLETMALQGTIDFLEDPVCIESNLKVLTHYKGPIKIALDRKVQWLSKLDSHYFVGVIKPAIDEPALIEKLLKSGYQLCFTSYLDHPIGQAWAAYQASQWQQRYPAQILTAGILSHSAYQANHFSALLSPHAYWEKLQGTGLGFDHLLTQLSWTSIKA